MAGYLDTNRKNRDAAANATTVTPTSHPYTSRPPAGVGAAGDGKAAPTGDDRGHRIPEHSLPTYDALGTGVGIAGTAARGAMPPFASAKPMFFSRIVSPCWNWVGDGGGSKVGDCGVDCEGGRNDGSGKGGNKGGDEGGGQDRAEDGGPGGAPQTAKMHWNSKSFDSPAQTDAIWHAGKCNVGKAGSGGVGGGAGGEGGEAGGVEG